MQLDDILKFGADIVSGSIQASGKVLGHMQIDGSFELSPDGMEWVAQFRTEPKADPAPAADAPARRGRPPKAPEAAAETV